jgi:hypothetical protein
MSRHFKTSQEVVLAKDTLIMEQERNLDHKEIRKIGIKEPSPTSPVVLKMKKMQIQIGLTLIQKKKELSFSVMSWKMSKL